jgi:hypothetical protein
MFLLNNQTNLVQMSMKGLTGTPTAGGTSKAAVTSLDPELAQLQLHHLMFKTVHL